MTEQLFLVTIQQMSVDKTAEVDVVCGWSAVVKESELSKLKLSAAVKTIRLTLKDAPLDLRSMTKKEISNWRKGEQND